MHDLIAIIRGTAVLLIVFFVFLRWYWRRGSKHAHIEIDKYRARAASKEFDSMIESLQATEAIFPRPLSTASRWTHAHNVWRLKMPKAIPPPWAPMRTVKFGYDESQTWSVSIVSAWFTTINGVTHRVGIVKHELGETAVLLCDETQKVENKIDCVPIDYAPMLSCLGCLSKAKD